MMARVMMLLSLTSFTKAFKIIPRSLSSKTSLSKISLASSDIQSEITPAFHGLLAGFTRLPNITSFSEIYYTDNLNLAACKEEFSKEDILWRTFMQDMKPDDSPAAVTESISRAAKEFINSNILCDRGEIIENLKTIEKGDMVIVTGGPSTGKSLVVKHLFANDSKYLYLDGRKTGPNILRAIVNNLSKRDNICFMSINSIKSVAPKLYSSFESIIGNNFVGHLKIPELFAVIIGAVAKSPEKTLYSLESILELM